MKRWIVLLLFVLLPVTGFASREECARFLAPLPQTKKILRQMLQSPEVPTPLKIWIQNALNAPGLKIRKLTPQLRKKFRISKNTGAFCSRGVDKNGNPTFLLGAPQRAGREYIDTALLIHELAHVQFFLFFNQNLDALLDVIPRRWMWITEDGEPEIDESFFRYLSERYAYQTEMQFLHAIPETILSQLDLALFREIFFAPADQEDLEISDFVIHKYRIEIPQAQNWGRYSIEQILSGAPWKKSRNASYLRRLRKLSASPTRLGQA